MWYRLRPLSLGKIFFFLVKDVEWNESLLSWVKWVGRRYRGVGRIYIAIIYIFRPNGCLLV